MALGPFRVATRRTWRDGRRWHGGDLRKPRDARAHRGGTGRMVDVTQLSRAVVLAVGSELLTPSRIDTNSLFITDQLNRIGIDVVLKLVVGDSREELARAFQLARSRAGLVVFCGGLGPTDDDVTREA